MAQAAKPLGPLIRDRNRHHSWVLRAPVLVWMAWLLLGYLGDPTASSIWGGINLAFHEIGHILFGFLPLFWSILGGTLSELAIPLVAGYLFLRQKEDFGAALALFWFATALLGASVYAGDARLQALPLVSPFSGDPLHDWNYMLGRLGLLERDAQVAGLFRGLGLLTMAGSVALGGWILGLMATDPERKGSIGAPRGPEGTGPEGTGLPGTGLAGGSDLEAEGRRFQAWLAAQDAREGGKADEPGPGPEPTVRSGEGGRRPGPHPSPGPTAAGDRNADEALGRLKDQVDPRTLTPEERRFLDFLKRDKNRG